MGPTERLSEAAERFEEGDDDRVVGCLHPSVTVYGEPELAGPPLARSADQCRALIARWREANPDASVALEHVEEHGSGLAADAILMGPRNGGSWRVALAIRFDGDLVSEVRPYWDRNAALESLTVSA